MDVIVSSKIIGLRKKVMSKKYRKIILYHRSDTKLDYSQPFHWYTYGLFICWSSIIDLLSSSELGIFLILSEEITFRVLTITV